MLLLQTMLEVRVAPSIAAITVCDPVVRVRSVSERSFFEEKSVRSTNVPL